MKQGGKRGKEKRGKERGRKRREEGWVRGMLLLPTV